MNERCARSWTTPWIVEVVLRDGVEDSLTFFVWIYVSRSRRFRSAQTSSTSLPNEENGSCASPLVDCDVLLIVSFALPV